MTWVDIPGLDGKFRVSDDGQVMSMNYAKKKIPGLLKLRLTRGYQIVQLSHRRMYTVHRLVMLAFVGERPDGAHINHKNGIKTDNRLENLEYCTPSENQKHSFRMGLQDNHGINHSQAKLNDDKIREIRKMVRSGFSQSEVARKMSVCPSTVSLVKSGKRWAHVVDLMEVF